jgi:hypothetical protein
MKHQSLRNWYPIGTGAPASHTGYRIEKTPFPGLFSIAGAGFEPATFGL